MWGNGKSTGGKEKFTLEHLRCDRWQRRPSSADRVPRLVACALTRGFCSLSRPNAPRRSLNDVLLKHAVVSDANKARTRAAQSAAVRGWLPLAAC
jgi:hypothetical protein